MSGHSGYFVVIGMLYVLYLFVYFVCAVLGVSEGYWSVVLRVLLLDMGSITKWIYIYISTWAHHHG